MSQAFDPDRDHRISRARHADGPPTMVMVAVDAGGQDLASTNATFAQNQVICPPICATTLWY